MEQVHSGIYELGQLNVNWDPENIQGKLASFVVVRDDSNTTYYHSLSTNSDLDLRIYQNVIK